MIAVLYVMLRRCSIIFKFVRSAAAEQSLVQLYRDWELNPRYDFLNAPRQSANI